MSLLAEGINKGFISVVTQDNDQKYITYHNENKRRNFKNRRKRFKLKPF